ncbi:hypothetical protein HDV06_002599 [Boothiomyces sp. JEL0866]|nr:hypothetical protein HDV06_002599 [Boothiomyces sp. JEL0866]
MLDKEDTIMQQEEIDEEEIDEQEAQRKQFYVDTTDMRNGWYPIFPVEEITSKKPTAFHILGDPIVLYRDPETLEPVALSDIFMDGKLECKYHGWQYDTDGKVVKIPSLMGGRKIPANAKARTYPLVESGGYIWLWPGNPEDINSYPPPTFHHLYPQLDFPPRLEYVDLDIDASLLMENFLDPSHLPFTHTGTIGKREKATAMRMDMKYAKDQVSGIPEMPLLPDEPFNEFIFFPPCAIGLRIHIKDRDSYAEQGFYVVPTTKGHCRFVILQRFAFYHRISQIPILSWIIYKIFSRMNYKILMEDYEMLKGQQRRLSYGANSMKSPVAADTLIKSYRNWWRIAVKKKPWFAGYDGDIEDIILDDYRGSC